MSQADQIARLRSGGLARKARGALSLARGPRPAEMRSMYLDLLERAVLHTLYHPLDIGEQPEFSTQAFRRAMTEQDIELQPIDARTTRAQGRDWPQYAQTMVGAKRLRNVRRCVQEALADGVPGDLIETGCWRGGVVILMRGILEAYGAEGRDVYVADSFQGVPKPDAERYPADEGDLNYTAEELVVSAEEVRENFRRYDLLDDSVKFLEGWFSETLPTVRENTWSVIRLDGDLYQSTMDSLVNLYPGLSIGGYIIIDDYGWDNCRAAVDDYRREQGITEPVEQVDWLGACWRKRA